MAKARLENWSITGDFFTSNIFLIGEVYNHPLSPKEHVDGKTVLTSYVVKINGKEITTKSGTVYVLGKIKEDYLYWMIENGHIYNEENPIKDLRKN